MATRVRRHRLLCDAGRHRSAHPSRNAVHGHLFGRRFRNRHARRPRRRHDHGRRFLPAGAAAVAARGPADVGQQDVEGAPATIPSTWRSPGGASRCSTRWPTVVDRGITSFKHFMAYKGALMVDDDEMYCVVPALRRSWRAAAGPCREWRRGCAPVSRSCWPPAITVPKAHAYSRPPEVEGEATNRAIMIADMAGVPLYIVHVSCEQAHEAIRRARQKGMRVFGEPLIQHLTLDESEYFNKDWDHAARRVMSPPFRNKIASGFAVGRPAGRIAAGGGDRPLRLHHQPEAQRRRRFHQDPERHRRARGPLAGAVDQGRQHRPADDERIRRCDLDQHRQHPQHVSEEGRHRRRRRCRHRRLGPEAHRRRSPPRSSNR